MPEFNKWQGYKGSTLIDEAELSMMPGVERFTPEHMIEVACKDYLHRSSSQVQIEIRRTMKKVIEKET